MKKYKLYLVNYEIKVSVPEEGEIIEKSKPYKVRETIANILCHPALKKKGYEFYKNGKLGDKIIMCSDDYVELTQEEYDQVKEVFDNFEGFARNDSELVARVYDATQIEKSKG